MKSTGEGINEATIDNLFFLFLIENITKVLIEHSQGYYTFG